MPMDKTGKQELQYSDKIDFEIKAINQDKEVQYLIVKGSIHEADITSIYICPNIGAARYL